MPKIEISDAAFAFLQQHAEPFVDTPASALDKVLFGNASAVANAGVTPGTTQMHFAGTNLPSVKFTVIRNAMIDGKPVQKNTWNHILEDMISICSERGANTADILHVLKANKVEGEKTDNGFRHVPGANLSFQGLEANRACENIIRLAEKFAVPVSIEIRWNADEGAQHPGKSAVISHP